MIGWDFSVDPDIDPDKQGPVDPSAGEGSKDEAAEPIFHWGGTNVYKQKANPTKNRERSKIYDELESEKQQQAAAEEEERSHRDRVDNICMNSKFLEKTFKCS